MEQPYNPDTRFGTSLNEHLGPDVKPYTPSKVDELYGKIEEKNKNDKQFLEGYAKRRQNLMDQRLGEFAQKAIQVPFKNLEKKQESGSAPTKVLPLEANRKVNIPLDEIQNGIFIGQRLNDRKLGTNEKDTISRASLALDVKNSKGGALKNAEGCGLYIEPSSDRRRFDITNPIGNRDVVIWVGENREKKVVIKADGKVKQIDMTNKSGIVFVMGGENGNKQIKVKNHLKEGSITVESKHLESEKKLKPKNEIKETPKQPKKEGITTKNGGMAHELDGRPRHPWAILEQNGFPENTPIIYGGEPNIPKNKERFAVALTKKGADQNQYPIRDDKLNLIYPPEIVKFQIINGKLELTCLDKPLNVIGHRTFMNSDVLNDRIDSGVMVQINPNSTKEFTVDNKLRFIVTTGDISAKPPEINIEVKSV